MLKTQIDIYDMALSVENHFDDSPDLWTVHTPVIETIELLSDKIGTLREQVGIQLINNTGITQYKKNLRNSLEQRAVIIGAGGSSYASVLTNQELYKRFNMVKSTLLRYRDAELQSVCTNLLSASVEYQEEIKPYGITPDLIAAFQENLASFISIMTQPKDAIAKKKAATDKIPGLLKDLTALLKTRMDNLMIAFKAGAPEFVNVYFNLRRISPTGGRPLNLTVSTIDAVTKEPIANAVLEIIGTDIKRVSSKRGYNKVALLKQGVYEIAVSQGRYKPTIVSFTVVSGETTELQVLLVPLE
jgi:hypothetical protein